MHDIVQDVKSTPELVAQDRQYLNPRSPDCGDTQVLNILELFTLKEQRTIMAFDHYTFTSLAALAHNINTLREVRHSRTRSPHHHKSVTSVLNSQHMHP